MVDRSELEGFPARLAELIGPAPVSRFAAEVGLGDNLVRKYLEGATPGLDKVIRIAEAKGISLEWLATGEGPKNPQAGTEIAEARRARRLETRDAGGETAYNGVAQGGREILEARDGRQFFLLPSYDVRVSAGGGSVLHSEQIVAHFSFNKDWWDKFVGIPPERALLVEVHGDSMVPDLYDGEKVIVDTGKNAFVGDAIYILLVGGELRIKKVHQKVDGSVEIRSSNVEHSTETLTPDQAAELVIVGRSKRAISDRRLP